MIRDDDDGSDGDGHDPLLDVVCAWGKKRKRDDVIVVSPSDAETPVRHWKEDLLDDMANAVKPPPVSQDLQAGFRERFLTATRKDPWPEHWDDDVRYHYTKWYLRTMAYHRRKRRVEYPTDIVRRIVPAMQPWISPSPAIIQRRPIIVNCATHREFNEHRTKRSREYPTGWNNDKIGLYLSWRGYCDRKSKLNEQISTPFAVTTGLEFEYARSKWSYLVQQAKQRRLICGITWEQALEMMRGDCHFCGATGHPRYNGIDRYDNSRGYEEGNSVAACWKCNKMKKNYDANYFIESIVRVHLYTTQGVVTEDPTRDVYRRARKEEGIGRGYFNEYARASSARGREFEMTQASYNKLRVEPCVYCGILDAGGIDRVANGGGYTPDNIVASCTVCNLVKGTFDDPQAFLEHVQRIYEHQKERTEVVL
ncbi:putative HNH endonuclease [Acanthamoeba castellanii medusavirus]|uniref:HNH endonuclease n=1 Tax=Acanthamoeba castellanii medusavirus J1 TaxID=3114988 RepID=A0A3T1CWW2_9VIRU|nr:putative HNH endonuclease [Acanthamoeba castellanii medusavirus]BBI30316.1 putative HNH endonuclease [Acanthamoeba castellanii medusavirus J1]